jgi:hypothetical protein
MDVTAKADQIAPSAPQATGASRKLSKFRGNGTQEEASTAYAGERLNRKRTQDVRY